MRLQGRSNEDISALIEAVNKTGKAFLITTDLAGQTVARIACGGFMTQVAFSPSVGTCGNLWGICGESVGPCEEFVGPCGRSVGPGEQPWQLQCSRVLLAYHAWCLYTLGRNQHNLACHIVLCIACREPSDSDQKGMQMPMDAAEVHE